MLKKNGSMTAAMSLMMLVLLSLVAAGLQAVQTACSRVQAVNAVDTGLYSLFSEYDKELLEKYHLFFLNSGYGEEKQDPAQMINQIEYYMKPILSSGLIKSKLLACGAEGIRVASDNKGRAVEQQMNRYMKKNLGMEQLENIRRMLTESQQIMKGQQAAKDAGIQEKVSEETEPMKGISPGNNPLEIFRNIKNNGFLGMVIPQGSEVSKKERDLSSAVSKRKLQTGMGDFTELKQETSALDKIWIQEYILEHMNTYTDQNTEGVFQYETEYILGGKSSDKENLSYVVKRLLLIREVSNLAYLYTDAKKRGELEACAAALSVLALIPEGMALVQAVLAAGWAYVESLSDVKILLSGGRVPMSKDGDSWKTQLGNLYGDSIETGKKGLDYEEYLRILFFMSSKEKAVIRAMDLIEWNIKAMDGKNTFAMDACVDAVSVSFRIQGPKGSVWQADRMYSYDM